MKRVPKSGVALLLGFVIFQAIRDVHLGHLFDNHGLFEAAFLAFGTAALVFGTGLLIFRRDQIQLLRREWRGVLALNITTLLAWMRYFGSLRLVEPGAANLAFSGVAPIAVAGLGTIGLSSVSEANVTRVERFLHWMLLGIVVLLAVIVSTGRSGFAQLDPQNGLTGIALAAFAGIAITAESLYAKRMNVMGISPLALVGVHFLMVTVFAGLMVSQIDVPYAGLSSSAILQQAVVFLAILIGPIYLAQAGLALTSPLVSGVILSISPIATPAGGLMLAPAMLAIGIFYALVSVTAASISAAD